MDDNREEEHTANTALCTLCSRAQALISEIYRLKDRLPNVFYPEQNPKYEGVLFDFKYLKSPEAFDERVEASSELLDLWDELRENYLPLLERYFQLFDRVVRYHQDAIRFLEDLQEGVYIQHTLEGILKDTESRQLLVESLSLFGTMLLLLDECFDGPVRERVVVTFLRSKGTSDIPNIEDVVRLCRVTGYSRAEPLKRPRGYPEEYLARFQFPDHVLLMLVGRLRLDDLYNGIAHYPLPEHRSTALAQQAVHAYIILFFVPEVLHRETAIMRELVDKHFVDNWVVPWSHGFFADLTLVWEPYKAARSALDTAIPSAYARKLTETHAARLAKLQADLPALLFEGVLDEDFLMTNQELLMVNLREANATLRWLLLHSHGAVAGRLRPAFDSRAPPAEQIVAVMLDTAELEFVMKKVTTTLLDTKSARWDSARREAFERVSELAEFFSGSKVLSKDVKDENLRRWFSHIAGEIEKLEPKRPVSTGRKIQQLVAALEEVEQFHQVDGSLQTKQYLLDTRLNLQKMVRTLHVTDQSLMSLAVISDTSWAWGAIQRHTPILHERIRKDPQSVLKLRCLFLKLKSVLELPLLRISQIGSPDVYSVGEFYSQELVQYVRSVVEVIPKSMFSILTRIIAVQTDRLMELPTRLEKTSLKEYAQLEERFQLAEATHAVAVLTTGILAMEKTFMGVIELDPQQLLEDGIRKQVVAHVAEAFHGELQFVVKESGMFSETVRGCTPAEFEARLAALAGQLEGFRRSFEYIQDYVNIAGLRVWHEELGRMVNFTVEQECNAFLRGRLVHDWQSAFQSEAIPIPLFAPTDGESLTFMGRLGREMLRQTDPVRTTYLDPLSAWFHLGDGSSSEGTCVEAMGIRTLSLLRSAVGVAGLAGLDRLYSFMLVFKLQSVVNHYRARLESGAGDVLAAARRALGPPVGLPEGGLPGYAESLARASKAVVWGPLQEALTLVGQAQLLRRHIASELCGDANLDSYQLAVTLEACNAAVMEDIREHYRQPDSAPYPAADSALLPELSALLLATGQQNPLAQIYIMQEPLRELPVLLFFFTLAQLNRYTFDHHLVVGMVTLLRQFHISQTHAYLALVGQYCRVQAQQPAAALAQDSRARAEPPPELCTAVALLESFCRYSEVPRDVVQQYVPPYIMDAVACKKPDDGRSRLL